MLPGKVICGAAADIGAMAAATATSTGAIRTSRFGAAGAGNAADEVGTALGPNAIAGVAGTAGTCIAVSALQLRSARRDVCIVKK